MNRFSRARLTTAACGVVAFAAAILVSQQAPNAQGSAPSYAVQPLWPQPFPTQQVIGSIGGVAVDSRDHVWTVNLGASSLEEREKGMMIDPPSSSICCVAAPFVIEFDPAGKMVSHFGGPGQGYQWPETPGGIAVDAQGNVWIAAVGKDPVPAGATARSTSAGARAGAVEGAGKTTTADAHVLKFARDGKFLLQIGQSGKSEGADSKTTLNRPSAVAVDSSANEVYVADMGNRRVVVFDANTGAYKRHWGAYGEAPGADPGAYDPAAPPAKQFRDITCIDISKDGLVYVCDRSSDRIQVFQKNGKFVKEGLVSKTTTGTQVVLNDRGVPFVLTSRGSVWDLAFSNDAQQRYIFVADGHDKKVIVLQRDTLAQVGSFGGGGRYPGQFLMVNSIAVDSKGNVFTGEGGSGKRVQQFVPKR